MQKKSHLILILVTSLSILTTFVSLFILFSQNPVQTDTFQQVTGASTTNLDNMEFHEGYSQTIDLNQDGLADEQITLNYADKGLASLKVETLKSYCKGNKQE